VTAAALLEQLVERGVELEVAGNRLRWAAPKGVLTDELRQEIVDHKSEIIAILAPQELAVSATCLVCGGTREPTLYAVMGRPAVRCSACGTWDLVGGAS